MDAIRNIKRGSESVHLCIVRVSPLKKQTGRSLSCAQTDSTDILNIYEYELKRNFEAIRKRDKKKIENHTDENASKFIVVNDFTVLDQKINL